MRWFGTGEKCIHLVMPAMLRSQKGDIQNKNIFTKEKEEKKVIKG